MHTENPVLHHAVLFSECLHALQLGKDKKTQGIYIDATFGRGGHSKGILTCLDDNSVLIMIDKDAAAISHAQDVFGQDARCKIYHGSFAQIGEIAEQAGVMGKVNGILLDLGVSSPQLETPDRGFSFLRDGPLDMRMDQRSYPDAATWINDVREEDMANVLYRYGEERYSRRIARKIVEARLQQPIMTTLQLANLIAEAHPAWEKHHHPATKSFQAIRIFINRELADLEQALASCEAVLADGGRLAVISFHSLEDRIVKQFLKPQGASIPAYIPMKAHEMAQSVRSKMRAVGKMIRPTTEEVAKNPRARSALLRIGEKIT